MGKAREGGPGVSGGGRGRRRCGGGEGGGPGGKRGREGGRDSREERRGGEGPQSSSVGDVRRRGRSGGGEQPITPQPDASWRCVRRRISRAHARASKKARKQAGKQTGKQEVPYIHVIYICIYHDSGERASSVFVVKGPCGWKVNVCSSLVCGLPPSPAPSPPAPSPSLLPALKFQGYYSGRFAASGWEDPAQHQRLPHSRTPIHRFGPYFWKA